MTGKPTYDKGHWIPIICARMSGEGEEGHEPMSLRKACEPIGTPSIGHFLRWVREDDEVGKQYARARAQLLVYWSVQSVDISDDTDEDVQRSKLRIDTRKWFLSKLMPKVYGDRAAVEIDQSQHVHLPGGEALAELAKDPAIRAEAVRRLHAGEVKPLANGHEPKEDTNGNP